MKNLFLVLIFNIILATCIHASTPLWTFTPLTPTTISIHPLEVKFIDYLVTNQASISHTLALQPYPYAVRSSEPFACGQVFTLAPHQSCILSFLVNGLAVEDAFRGGPILCESDNHDLCYIPSQQDVLTVIYHST